MTDDPPTFFKVVRLNLTSFADPKFKYRFGVVQAKPWRTVRRYRVICEPGLLHVSPSAPEAARYGKWPYRLLEVDPEGAEPVAREDDKAGFLTLRVIGERPVSECFGPNGDAVLRLILRAEHLDFLESARLVDAWKAAGAAAVGASKVAADAAWYASRYDSWDNAGNAAWTANFHAPQYADWEAISAASRNATPYASWYALTSAVRAVAVADLIGQHGFTQDHFDLLTGPWREVIGETWEE